MTNTRITDAEVFERRYPVLLREFALRSGTAGAGKYRGGEGVVRDIEFRIPVQVSILSERRVWRPYGMEGGGDGACGRNSWMRKVAKSKKGIRGGGVNGEGAKEDGESGAGDEDEYEFREINLGGKNTAAMQPGERIVVRTPGGGGWGTPVGLGEEDAAAAAAAAPEKKKKDEKHAWRMGSLQARVEMQESSV